MYPDELRGTSFLSGHCAFHCAQDTSSLGQFCSDLTNYEMSFYFCKKATKM